MGLLREWHPQGKVPSKLGTDKMLTPYLRWHGSLVPTARLNSSIGAGWITPASLQKRPFPSSPVFPARDRGSGCDWRRIRSLAGTVSSVSQLCLSDLPYCFTRTHISRLIPYKSTFRWSFTEYVALYSVERMRLVRRYYCSYHLSKPFACPAGQ